MVFGAQNKWCFVPGCRNTSISAPSKKFVSVPKVYSRKVEWFKAARRDFSKTKSTFFCCEDHFNFKEDMENYIRYTIMGGKILLRRDVVPHIFDCQPDRKRVTGDALQSGDMENFNSSSTRLKYAMNFVKKELNCEEQENVNVKISEVDINSENIGTSDIKQEPTEIIFFKSEAPCPNCYHNLEEGAFWLLSNLGANDLYKTVPKNFLKIDRNVSVLRCIPQDIMFGPYADFESLQNATSLMWILNGGRRVEIDNKFLDNWMRFIPFSTDKDQCNLRIFQCNHLLYFRTIRNIDCEEELLAYLDERLVKPSSEKSYYPIEYEIPQAYVCMPCCLGFKTEWYLRKHLEICFNEKESNRSVADIVQCPLCKMVSFNRKHLKDHISRHCDKRYIGD